MEGIITVYLKEDYTNEWAPAPEEAPEEAPSAPFKGPLEVYPFDVVTYSIPYPQNGTWVLSNKRAVILEQNESSVTIEITTGKSGEISLIYRAEGIEDIVQNIKILSL
jgi:hypothetical protein